MLRLQTSELLLPLAVARGVVADRIARCADAGWQRFAGGVFAPCLMRYELHGGADSTRR